MSDRQRILAELLCIMTLGILVALAFNSWVFRMQLTRIENTLEGIQKSLEDPADVPVAPEAEQPAEAQEPQARAIFADPRGRIAVNEIPVILHAAKRNELEPELIPVLMAIRVAEGGRSGREFGVLHPRAVNTNLDTQAGWAAATIKKQAWRYEAATGQSWRSDPRGFVQSLAQRYCPPEAHPLNRNWEPNVLRLLGL